MILLRTWFTSLLGKRSEGMPQPLECWKCVQPRSPALLGRLILEPILLGDPWGRSGRYCACWLTKRPSSVPPAFRLCGWWGNVQRWQGRHRPRSHASGLNEHGREAWRARFFLGFRAPGSYILICICCFLAGAQGGDPGWLFGYPGPPVTPKCLFGPPLG